MKARREIRPEGASYSCGYDVPTTVPASLTVRVSMLANQHRLAFGRNLHHARARANRSLGYVAAMSGVSESCIRAIEAGQCDSRLKTMTALAHVVDCDLWTLLTLPEGGGE
jgi:DNA-binding XRE family transcriptional regulator